MSTSFSNECYSGWVLTNVNEPDSERSVDVYPNPTTGSISLSATEASFSEEDRAMLYNLRGELLSTSPILSPQTAIDLSDYPKGTYLLSAHIHGVYKTFKVLKE